LRVTEEGDIFLFKPEPTDIVAQPISVTTLPLPNGAATNATLEQVRDAIKASLDVASTIWTDDTGAFYVRRDLVNQGTGTIMVAFTTPAGDAASPGAGLRPLASTDKDTITDFYDVLAGGTGYSIGDLLARVAIVDVNSGTPSVTAVWLNLSLGTVLGSTPTNIERANENVGARQIGNWTVSLPSGTAVPLFTSSSTSGAIAAGRISISFSNFGNAAGTLLGASLPAGAVVSFAAPPGQTLGAFTFDASGTTFLIGGLQ
jgi:hypothetical protein